MIGISVGDWSEVRAGIAACQADVECDDGLFCNGLESCIFGTCLPGTAPSCDDAMACTLDDCDDLMGCQNDPDPNCTQPIPTTSRPGLLALMFLLGAAGSLLARRARLMR